ncbi:hypothetical protein BDM02DRAFT_3109797 [Thelephora ganbajun]|uniref:Uncharacterized protein n=1 Tax=Thelephora ganbajun TaxID=370292 RepID=A0ACB6ZR66_THEGA|nr:hypothetical protein BDM02DRAFT_3109797 [Thelephora ganbajun]
MNSSNFASSFAPYTPPPDDPAHSNHPPGSRISNAWFPTHYQQSQSYQSGGIPTFNASVTGGQGALDEAESQVNRWESRLGPRIDAMAALAYVLGPLSALLLLILETQNDYVRFHAYQSGLLTGPLLLFRFLLSLVNFPQFLRTFTTLFIIFTSWGMAAKAFIDAERNSLARFQLPYIGPIAERWLSEE